MFKKVLLFPLLFLLNGCFSNNYYVLSTASQPVHHYMRKNRIIGIEKVIVPKYLFKREIAVAQSNSHIGFLSGAVWAEDLDAGLTQRLIGFLQKKFNQPNVYAYPWGVERQPTVKVSVQITRFIAQGEKVYLDANWKIEDMKTHKIKAKLFSVAVPASREATAIVAAMDKAFGLLEERIAEGLR